MEEFYQTVQREQEFLEDELKHLKHDLEYLEHQRMSVENDIKRTKDLINKVEMELEKCH